MLTVLEIKTKARELDEYTLRTLHAIEMVEQVATKDGQLVSTPISESGICVPLEALRSYAMAMNNAACDLYALIVKTKEAQV